MNKYYLLYEFLLCASEELRIELGKISISNREEELPNRIKYIAKKLINLSDHVKNELEDLKPVRPSSEEFQITDELLEKVFQEGLKARDYSVAFLQRRFRLRYIDACKLQDELRRNGKIKLAFLVGKVICDG